MDKSEFDSAFRALVADRLAPHGFGLKGEALYLRDTEKTIALMRLGGRMAEPGSAAHLLCFRHNMLRDKWEKPLARTSVDVADYPFKFRPSDLVSTPEAKWTYRSQILHFDYDRLHWAGQPQPAVIQQLEQLGALIETRFLPWADAMTPRRAAELISKHSENAWIERLWLEDYAGAA